MDREIPGLAGGSRTPPASPTDGVAPCNPRTNPAPARWTPTVVGPGSALRRRNRRPPLPPPRPACARPVADLAVAVLGDLHAGLAHLRLRRRFALHRCPQRQPVFLVVAASSSLPAMPSRSCAPTIVMAAEAMPTAPRWRANTPPPPRPRPAPCSWRRAPPRAAAGTGRHVAGHTGRRTGRPGRDRARHGIRRGLACACRSAACLAGLSRAGRRHGGAGAR